MSNRLMKWIGSSQKKRHKWSVNISKPSEHLQLLAKCFGIPHHPNQNAVINKSDNQCQRGCGDGETLIRC